MKKAIKIIQPKLLLILNIFFLFNVLLVIFQSQPTDVFSSEGETVSYYSGDLNSTGIQSLFDEENLDDFEKGIVFFRQQWLFFRPNIFTLKFIKSKHKIHIRNSIFALQADLPPPESCG